jgi:hypothetical protein
MALNLNKTYKVEVCLSLQKYEYGGRGLQSYEWPLKYIFFNVFKLKNKNQQKYIKIHTYIASRGLPTVGLINVKLVVQMVVRGANPEAQGV